MKGHESIVKANSQITVTGTADRYIHGLIRTIYGTIDSLTFTTRYATIDLKDSGPMKTSLNFKGIARFENDRFSIIGNKEFATSIIQISFSPTQVESELWTAGLGFIESDWEIGNDNEWFLACYISNECFNDILHAYKNNFFDRMTFSIRGSFWAHEHEQHKPPSGNVCWYLVPDKYGCPIEKTVIRSIDWSYLPRMPAQTANTQLF
jgi:hypothetical protein